MEGCPVANGEKVETMRPRRPNGISSRLHRATGPVSSWKAPNGQSVDLPVRLDLMHLRPDGSAEWRIEATVDLVDDHPQVVSVIVASAQGLDLKQLQQRFRWATPLEVVTRLVPALLENGDDPFTFDYPANGYPDAAVYPRQTRHQLSDEFLEDVARRYLDLGRGYAAAIAAERDVSPRTAVSWIEKARARGILSASRPGAHGGHIVPKSEREQSDQTI